jgi:hypothetical protein
VINHEGFRNAYLPQQGKEKRERDKAKADKEYRKLRLSIAAQMAASGNFNLEDAIANADALIQINNETEVPE